MGEEIGGLGLDGGGGDINTYKAHNLFGRLDLVVIFGEMVLEKYKRWAYVIIDEQGRTWIRSKTKGWFEWVEFDQRNDKGEGGYCKHSKFLTHPDFFGSMKITKHNFRGFNISINKL